MVSTLTIPFFKAERVPHPINIVYTVDETSIPYFLVSISSIVGSLHSGFNSRKLLFYVIICGETQSHAKNTEKNIRDHLNCLKISNVITIPFTHPLSSPLRLSSFKSNTNPHWFANTETVRLLIPDILQNISRFIYLDNDTILTKNRTIQFLWNYNMGNNASLGLVLNKEYTDDTEHVLKTYFHRNNTHLQKYFPINETAQLISKEKSYLLQKVEYLSILPKFPNNGVMLVNALKWRENKLTQKLKDLAIDNIKYKYIIMGSQPYTLIGLFKYWIELPQSFNLRSQGSNAARKIFLRNRGKGIIHFAGRSKPHQRCKINTNFLHMNSFRAMEQTIFLNANTNHLQNPKRITLPHVPRSPIQSPPSTSTGDK
eukprot:gene993-1948_t